MADIFLNEDAAKLLYNKFVVILGDSNQRAIYKDLVLLLQLNKYLTNRNLRTKGELRFEDDDLVEGGQKGPMNNATSYREVRQYQTDFHLVRFYFLTKCYCDYVETILDDFSEEPKPDVVIMNSCLWDITRYGASSVTNYKKNLNTLFTRFNEVLTEDCLLIWNTTLPIANNARGGFLIPEIEFMNDTLRLDVMEANFFARQVVETYGYDVLDMHYFFRRQIHRRADDGVHWDTSAVRRMTNLILTHISEAWGVELPGTLERLLGQGDSRVAILKGDKDPNAEDKGTNKPAHKRTKTMPDNNFSSRNTSSGNSSTAQASSTAPTSRAATKAGAYTTYHANVTFSGHQRSYSTPYNQASVYNPNSNNRQGLHSFNNPNFGGSNINQGLNHQAWGYNQGYTAPWPNQWQPYQYSNYQGAIHSRGNGSTYLNQSRQY